MEVGVLPVLQDHCLNDQSRGYSGLRQKMRQHARWATSRSLESIQERVDVTHPLESGASFSDGPPELFEPRAEPQCIS